jgi:hypothetical protein
VRIKYSQLPNTYRKRKYVSSFIQYQALNAIISTYSQEPYKSPGSIGGVPRVQRSACLPLVFSHSKDCMIHNRLQNFLNLSIMSNLRIRFAIIEALRLRSTGITKEFILASQYFFPLSVFILYPILEFYVTNKSRRNYYLRMYFLTRCCLLAEATQHQCYSATKRC